MAEETGINLVLGMLAVVLAVWTQTIDGAPSYIEDVEAGITRFVAAFTILLGIAMLGWVLVGVGWILLQSSGLSKLLFIVVLSTLLVSAPRFWSVYMETLSAASDAENRFQRVAMIISSIGIAAIITVILWIA